MTPFAPCIRLNSLLRLHSCALGSAALVNKTILMHLLLTLSFGLFFPNCVGALCRRMSSTFRLFAGSCIRLPSPFGGISFGRSQVTPTMNGPVERNLSWGQKATLRTKRSNRPNLIPICRPSGCMAERKLARCADTCAFSPLYARWLAARPSPAQVTHVADGQLSLSQELAVKSLSPSLCMQGVHVMYTEWGKKYGKVFKVRQSFCLFHMLCRLPAGL